MRTGLMAPAAALAVIIGAAQASAQTWRGPYVGGSAGSVVAAGMASETITFDTNLDGTFGDTVRTAAGADAFSPGFCGGIARTVVPATGCVDDDRKMDYAGRAGYDWQRGALVFGGLVDVAMPNAIDGASAFSTTPAFYAFSREMRDVVGLRGRVGVGLGRTLIYATGGGASAKVWHGFTTSNAVNTFVPRTVNARAWGYQAGGGAEFRIAGPFSVTGEYLWMSIDDRDDATVRSQGPVPATNPFILVNPAGTDLQRSERFDVQSVRVGLGYRF
jgi:outer membrane immunogenic protein